MRYLIITFFILMASLTMQAQNYELTYIASFDKEVMLDRLDKTEKELKDKSTTRRFFKEAQPIEFKIIANSKAAYSYRESQMESDHIKININNALYNENNKYYLNFTENEYVFKKRHGSKVYRVSFQPHEYEILSDKAKVINGFNCRLALVKDENIKVWFTMDYPLNIGPKKYIGLPGLVVKVLENTMINYELKSIKETKTQIKTFDPTQEVITEKEYKDMLDKMSQGLFEK
ncbi:MAG: GLPGLI family protein [Psychroflexus halocasei]